MAVQVSSYRHPSDAKSCVTATFDDYMGTDRGFVDGLVSLIAEKIAAKYVEEHYGEIAARLDQNAIANLAIADAGKKIAEEIKTRPVILREPGARINVIKNSLF